jgi:hypothetical protein
VPIVLTYEDVDHYRTALGFDVPLPLQTGPQRTGAYPRRQARHRAREAIEQLMIYPRALARRSHLLLSRFRCAWFADGSPNREGTPPEV